MNEPMRNLLLLSILSLTLTGCSSSRTGQDYMDYIINKANKVDEEYISAQLESYKTIGAIDSYKERNQSFVKLLDTMVADDDLNERKLYSKFKSFVNDNVTYDNLEQIRLEDAEIIDMYDKLSDEAKQTFSDYINELNSIETHLLTYLTNHYNELKTYYTYDELFDDMKVDSAVSDYLSDEKKKYIKFIDENKEQISEIYTMFY